MGMIVFQQNFIYKKQVDHSAKPDLKHTLK